MAEKESVEAVEEDQPLLKRPRTRRTTKLEEQNAHFDPNKPSVNILSEHVLLEVFFYLDIVTCSKLRRVSKKWDQVFVKRMKAVKIYDSSSIFGSYKNHSWDKMLAVLEYCQNIEVLRLGPGLLASLSTRKGMSEMNKIHQYCPKIVSMYLPRVELSRGSVLSLAEFSGLQLLDLSHSIVSNTSGSSPVEWNLKKTEENLHTAFTSLSNLACLKLMGCKIEGTCLEGVNRGKLECLDISHCTFTTSGIDAFLGKEWPELKKLVARFFRIKGNLHESDFMNLLVAKVKKLQHLNITDCPDDVTRNLEVLAELEEFRELQAEGIYDDSFSAYLAALASNPESAGRLEMLDLYFSILKPETVALISNLSGLKELHLGTRLDEVLYKEELNCVNGETVFKVCRGCRKLEKITMRSFPKLCDACLASIGRYCSSLTYFDCIDCENITNQGLEALVNGLRSSNQREKEKKIEIFAKWCSVDVNSLQIHDSWVSVNVDDIPSANLDQDREEQLGPSIGLESDEGSSNSSYDLFDDSDSSNC